MLMADPKRRNMEKKFVLKKDIETFADGSSNSEHIKDIIGEIKVCYDNIQANNDVCFQMYKLKESASEDQDTLDAISLVCEDAVLLEKEADQIIEVISQAEENIKKYSKENEVDFNNLLLQIQKIEEKSSKLMEKVLK